MKKFSFFVSICEAYTSLSLHKLNINPINMLIFDRFWLLLFIFFFFRLFHHQRSAINDQCYPLSLVNQFASEHNKIRFELDFFLWICTTKRLICLNEHCETFPTKQCIPRYWFISNVVRTQFVGAHYYCISFCRVSSKSNFLHQSSFIR